MLGYIVVLCLLLVGLFCYFYYHINRVVSVQKYQRLIISMMIMGLFVLMVLSRLFFGFVIHLIIALCLVDIIYLVIRKTKYKRYDYREVIAVIVACLLSGYGYMNVKNIHYVQYDVVIDKEFEDTRFLAVSDLHLSTAIQVDDLSMIKDKAQERHVDAILILGDLFDESTKYEDGKKAIAFFDKLAKDYPIYYIEGNHDINQGFKVQQRDSRLVDELTQSQVVVLRDEWVQIKNIQLVGRLDRSDTNRQELSSFIQDVDLSQPVVILDHQPVELKENAKQKADVQLSGHTHNGQIWPLGTICSLLHINELEYGLEDVDGMKAIVSSGMGVWGYAMRSQGQSEMIEINLISGVR